MVKTYKSNNYERTYKLKIQIQNLIIKFVRVLEKEQLHSI